MLEVVEPVEEKPGPETLLFAHEHTSRRDAAPHKTKQCASTDFTTEA